VERFRSKEGYTVFIKTTDNSFGRKLSAFLPFSKTHTPDQDQIEVLRPRRGKQNTNYSLLSQSSDGQAEGSPHSKKHDYQSENSVSEIISIYNGQSSCRSRRTGTTCRGAIKVTSLPCGPEEGLIHGGPIVS
jgi:hypothetical protein